MKHLRKANIVGSIDEYSYCPVCGATWMGEEIPEKDREAFGGSTHFRLVISVYDRDLDRTTHWRCPECLATWERGTGEMLVVKL